MIELEQGYNLFVLFILVVSFLWGSQPYTFINEMDEFLKEIINERQESKGNTQTG